MHSDFFTVQLFSDINLCTRNTWWEVPAVPNTCWEVSKVPFSWIISMYMWMLIDSYVSFGALKYGRYLIVYTGVCPCSYVHMQVHCYVLSLEIWLLSLCCKHSSANTLTLEKSFRFMSLMIILVVFYWKNQFPFNMNASQSYRSWTDV